MLGNGQYYFIPETGFIGTVFVNCISNILSTYATNAFLKLETLNGSKIRLTDGKL